SDLYYAGNMEPIRAVEVLQKSGPFRQHAWEVLRDVTPGHPVSYTEYATLSGSPKAIRAAAGACAFNAAALFVPCHRVLRNDGSLGGFRWGLAIKESLLAREATSS
ncbi:MAG: methylated-DNA--[protein]-cysteine S-methyltransferase, partial [Acidobacteria bacterium]|nr:methylated-DNA--[protein]-cysteine S-methyltransferase [Acidobacteriota bacterium]